MANNLSHEKRGILTNVILSIWSVMSLEATPISAKTGGSCISLSIISFNLCLHVLHSPELKRRKNTVRLGCNLLLTYKMKTKAYLTQLVRINQFCIVLPLTHSFPTLFHPLTTVLCLYHGRKFLPEPCIWCSILCSSKFKSILMIVDILLAQK